MAVFLVGNMVDMEAGKEGKQRPTSAEIQKSTLGGISLTCLCLLRDLIPLFMKTSLF